MTNQIEVRIDRQSGYDELGITFYYRGPGPDFSMLVLNPVYLVKDCLSGNEEADARWKWVEVKQGGVFKPTIKLPGIWLGREKAPLVALANELAGQGVFPDKFKAADEVMDATKYHLEDMRKLIFEEPI